MSVPIIGLVENMATYVCPHCNEEGDLFNGEDTEQLAKKKGIAFLGSVPFDTRISRRTETGSLFYSEFKDSPTGKAISGVTEKILNFIETGSK